MKTNYTLSLSASKVEQLKKHGKVSVIVDQLINDYLEQFKVIVPKVEVNPYQEYADQYEKVKLRKIEIQRQIDKIEATKAKVPELAPGDIQRLEALKTELMGLQ